jgi:hypothetical protein
MEELIASARLLENVRLPLYPTPPIFGFINFIMFFYFIVEIG